MECTYFYFTKQFFLCIDSLKLSVCTKVFVGWSLRIFCLIPIFKPTKHNTTQIFTHREQVISIRKKGYKSFHFSCKCPDCNGCFAENYAKYFKMISLTILEDILTRNCFVFFLINLLHNSKSIACLWPWKT